MYLADKDDRVIFLFESVMDRNDAIRMIVLEYDSESKSRCVVEICEFDLGDIIDYRIISKIIRNVALDIEYDQYLVGYSIFSGKYFSEAKPVTSTVVFNNILKEAITCIKGDQKFEWKK